MKRFILFSLLVLFSKNVLAIKTEVVLAGFSINAEYKDLERSAYYTNKLLDKYQGKQNIIDQTLQKEIRSNSFNHINILEDSTLISNETSKIAMSVFLDQELFEGMITQGINLSKYILPKNYDSIKALISR